jgi:23S rRNA (pseudouridine1915-N3)-methyltransferase
MKLKLICIGGIKQEYAQLGCALFESRIKAFGIPFEVIELKDSIRTDGANAQKWKAEEAIKIRKALEGAGGIWVAMDEKGIELNSVQFADWIDKQQNQSTKALSFVIGGPDGLEAELRASADLKLRLGAMTLPHELARLVLTEQLYRAYSILKNLPYHRI